MDPVAFLEKRTRTRFEDQMERILSGARRLADLPTTRATTREKLLLECANVRTALQELVAEYVNYVSMMQQIKRTEACGLLFWKDIKLGYVTAVSCNNDVIDRVTIRHG